MQTETWAKHAPQPADFGAPERMKKVAKSMHEFNTYVASNPHLRPLLLPLRDGLTLIYYTEH